MIYIGKFAIERRPYSSMRRTNPHPFKKRWIAVVILLGAGVSLTGVLARLQDRQFVSFVPGYVVFALSAIIAGLLLIAFGVRLGTWKS
jgi:uncharacterized membrane protein